MDQFGGVWSEKKLDCVEDYTIAYLKVMQKQTWCALHYVDAFAGRGKQALKSLGGAPPSSQNLESLFGSESEQEETNQFLIGSAIRALRASQVSNRPFDRFTLVDAHPPTCRDLEQAVETGFPDARPQVDIVCDDANEALARYVDSTDWAKTRALVFLDPFGLEVGWRTIEKLAASQACDVWYLFPLGGVLRMMKNDGQIDEAWQRRLDQLFGTHEWFEEFYSSYRQETLFGDPDELVRKDASTDHVVRYIRERLRSAFPAVSEAGILRNQKQFPLFALTLGVSNPSLAAQSTALRIANHIVKGIDRT